MHKGQERVLYLDGLRGLAILLVIVWHYLGPIYAMHLPYGADYAWLPVVRHGWVGVQLFFLISGYVIFMTLERCSGFVDFMLRRWVRLFPAMLLGSLLIFAATFGMAEQMPGGAARPADLVPGLTLVNPFYYRQLFDLPVRSLDGAFWSLYVEAAFYLVIGLLFFRFGWQRAVAGLLVLFALMMLIPPLAHAMPAAMLPWARAFHRAGFGWFVWFASGALFLKARVTSDRGLFWLAIALGMVGALTSAMPGGLEPPARIAMVLGVLFFAAVQRSARLQRALETPLLLFLGFVSYPLYLVHSAVGVGLIAVLARRAAGLPPLLPPLLVTGAMLALAWAIATWAEPAAARLLRPVADAARRLLGVHATSVAPRPPGAPA